ncbi:hypothetical protein [Kitasatospora sp. NBC_00458]|uniref:hypothetical protein n=1 Tax=Kitasatospora sp. NBC_00458 TaxID=2903568 RepID=UPI002E19FB8B
MPSLLRYEILTDPTSLPASSDGAPSVGSLYVIVSNIHQEEVEFRYIDVEIPIGPDPDHLTTDSSAITPSLTLSFLPPWLPDPKFTWNATLGLFRAEHSQSPGQRVTLPGTESIVLKLENVPVSRGGGLTLVKIHERTGGGDQNAAMPTDSFTTTLAVVKQAPRNPRNFRPSRALLDADAGQQLQLQWDGPGNLDYWIRYPDGTVELAAQATTAPPVVDQPYSLPVPTPRRGTTYTLLAGTADGGQPQYGYFLTTTVHALIPEFESGTRSPWVEGTTDRGRVTFTPDGAKVDDLNQTPGTVYAKTADVHDVRTESVKGRTSDSGWIDFPDTGIDVYHGLNKDLGVVTADRADVNGVNTKWVGDRAAGNGWIGFPQNGIDVRKDGTQEWGTVAADKADLNGLNTKWVGDRDGGKGWIEFPQAGIDVRKDGGQEWGTVAADKADLNGLNTKWVGDRDGGKGWIEFPQNGIDVRKDGGQEWGTVAADKADLNGINTKWVQGRSTSDGWIEFPTSGLRVYRDGGHDLGDVSANRADLNVVNTVKGRVTGPLTVGGGMQLSHEGERMFVTMPDRIVFFGINEFKKWVTFDRGVGIAFGHGTVQMTKEGGVLVHGSDVQIQQGKLSISTGNPPQVREL